jgi:predicted membrane protein
MSSPAPSGYSTRLVVGLVVIILGVLLTLDNLGLVEIESPLRYWPVLLIALGLSKSLQGRSGGSRGWGIALLVVGLWLLLRNLDLMPVRLEDFWPVLLVLAGAALVWQAVRGRAPRQAGGDSDAVVNAAAFLGGVERRSNSKEFRGGDLTAVLGGCAIDLTQASTGAGEAVIEVFAFWGGIDIKVPSSWAVALEGTALLGAMEDKAKRAQGASSGRLVVRGLVIMGGVEIKSE